MAARKEEEKRYIRLEGKSARQYKFDFKTYELAFTVREILYEKIIKFDANEDMQFQQAEIRDFLITVLLEKETEVHYFIKNVFRYDTNNDGVIQYDQLVNFCMEQHLGEIAIQRLHRQKIYLKGSQRLMNEEEFIKTINYALSFLQFKPTPNHLQILFKTVDMDGDGDISYEDYFRFLKQYFGSKSYASKLVNAASIKQQLMHAHEHPNEKKDLDIVRKYSKYQNSKNEGQKQNPNNKNNESSFKNPNNSHMKASNTSHASNLENSGINNSNHSQVSKSDPFGTEGSAGKKRASFSQGIVVTIGNKQSSNKGSSKEIFLSEQQAGLVNKIARLTLSQLKIIIISLDINKTLRVSYEEVVRYLKQGLKFSEVSLQLVGKKGASIKERGFSYQQATKFVISQFISKIFYEANLIDWSRSVSLEQFSLIFDKICSIVSNTPLCNKYQELYKLRWAKGAFDYNEFYSFACYIFNHYNFPS